MPRAIPVPGWLKRLIVPCWNAAHHHAWLAYDYLNATGHGRVESLRRLRPVSSHALSPADHSAAAGRDSGASRRNSPKPWRGKSRAFARTVAPSCERGGSRGSCSRFTLSARPLPRRGRWRRWVEHPESRSLRIAEINRIDGLHEQLARLPHFSSSDYHPGAEPGSIVGRCPLRGLDPPDLPRCELRPGADLRDARARARPRGRPA